MAFAPKYKSAKADAYADARLIYDSSPSASQGVYERDGLVFVIVEIDTNAESVRHFEGAAMLRTVALLRKAYPRLPPVIKAPNRLVEKRNDAESGLYRHATVFRLADLQLP
ncbi:MAG: hypothetical protein LBR12_02835 [Opitutaceae bacterium]|nr:hypothetical protein [Opitutaceae bacterium]